MQKTIDLLRSRGELREIHDELDIYLEIPHIAYIEVKKENSKALLFTNPVNKKDGIKFKDPVLMNLSAHLREQNFFLDVKLKVWPKR